MDETLYELSQNISCCNFGDLFEKSNHKDSSDLGNAVFNQGRNQYCTTDIHNTKRIPLSGSFSIQLYTKILLAYWPRNIEWTYCSPVIHDVCI